MDWPYPAHTVVLGLHRSDGMPIMSSCRDHLFELTSDPVSCDYGCGWRQSAQCLVCGVHTPGMDSDWWWAEATEEDYERCLKAVRAEVERLADAYDLITMRSCGERIVLMDFG